MVLPGQLFAFYDWGGTYDPILPALTDRPVAVRSIVPYADLRAVDLQWTTDALVQPAPRRARPAAAAARPHGRRGGRAGQRRRPLAQRRRAGRRGRAGPRRARPAGRLVRPGADAARRDRDARARRAAARGAALRACRRAGSSASPAERAHRRRRLGAGDRRSRRLRRAANGPGAALRGRPRRRGLALARGRGRRRSSSATRIAAACSSRRGCAATPGWTVPAGESLSEDAAVLDPFPDRGTDAQTVAVVGGSRGCSADFSPGFAQFPERRPFAALDGDPSTAWLADRALARDRHRLEVRFTAPRDVDHVDLLPYSDGRGRVEAVASTDASSPSGRASTGSRWACTAFARSTSDRARSGGRARARAARAASASCASPAYGRPRRCARRCSSSARCAARTSAARA